MKINSHFNRTFLLKIFLSPRTFTFETSKFFIINNILNITYHTNIHT